MSIARYEASQETFAEYARIPIAFETDVVLDCVATGSASDGRSYRLVERPLATTFRKDYDLSAGENPRSWALRFDVSRWAVFLARNGELPVAGAVVAWNTSGVELLEERTDLALLWDLRVTPAHRRRGLGRVLLEEVESWARERGCRELVVETQNTNVAACRFYARHGFVLSEVHEGAYPELPDERQLLWHKTLT